MERAASYYEEYIKNDINLVIKLDTSSTLGSGTLAQGGLSWYPGHVDFNADWTMSKITFDGNQNWYSGMGESFSGYDLFSVTLHEMGHAMGFLEGFELWDPLVSVDASGNKYFNGKNAMDVYGGPVPIDSVLYGGHWLDGTKSTLPGTGISQMAVYNPLISPGERRYLTDLDLAGLADVGWSVSASPVPEPGTLYLLLSGLGIVGLAARRRRRSF